MRFELMTDKTVNQSIKAINERLGQSPTKTRPEIIGYAHKETGEFSMAMSTHVFGRFPRQTRLRGKANRENGTTYLRGFVPNGITREQFYTLAIFFIILSLFMFVRGQLIYAILIVLAGSAMSIPLLGDHENYDRLLYELEKATKAKPSKKS